MAHRRNVLANVCKQLPFSGRCSMPLAFRRRLERRGTAKYSHAVSHMPENKFARWLPEKCWVVCTLKRERGLFFADQTTREHDFVRKRPSQFLWKKTVGGGGLYSVQQWICQKNESNDKISGTRNAAMIARWFVEDGRTDTQIFYIRQMRLDTIWQSSAKLVADTIYVTMAAQENNMRLQK